VTTRTSSIPAVRDLEIVDPPTLARKLLIEGANVVTTNHGDPSVSGDARVAAAQLIGA